MEKKKKKIRGWLIALLVLLALIAAAGIWYWQINTNPAGQFKGAPTPAPTSRTSSTMAPLIPIAPSTPAP